MAIPDVKDLTEAEDSAAAPQVTGPVDPPASRFLYVDISAMRAKQLRRGALPRLSTETQHPLKAERIAMEEVRKGLVTYDLPAFKPRAFTD
jgi:DNA-directed RNA polymerase subunit K/omega